MSLNFLKLNIFILLQIFVVTWGNNLLSQANVPVINSENLRIASCQFPVSADIEENTRWIIKQINEAAEKGADIVHFPECALSGYPGTDMNTLDGFSWDELHSCTDTILSSARKLGIWTLLGSIHELGPGFKPMNSLYVIDPSGKIADRYDKRFCTIADLKHFSAGNHSVVFEINGIKCGLLICYDVRFPELYREYRRLDVDILFQPFYNARQKPGGIHPKIMPVTAQTRAATNYFYMSLTNSSAFSSWPCHFITPDGLIESKLEPDKPGILISDVDLSQTYYDASRPFREKAMEGILTSGQAPDHPRYLNRKGL